jgi:hypothetical protein
MGDRPGSHRFKVVREISKKSKKRKKIKEKNQRKEN